MHSFVNRRVVDILRDLRGQSPLIDAVIDQANEHYDKAMTLSKTTAGDEVRGNTGGIDLTRDRPLVTASALNDVPGTGPGLALAGYRPVILGVEPMTMSLPEFMGLGKLRSAP
jgi:hypothetical protein